MEGSIGIGFLLTSPWGLDDCGGVRSLSGSPAQIDQQHHVVACQYRWGTAVPFGVSIRESSYTTGCQGSLPPAPGVRSPLIGLEAGQARGLDPAEDVDGVRREQIKLRTHRRGRSGRLREVDGNVVDQGALTDTVLVGARVSMDVAQNGFLMTCVDASRPRMSTSSRLELQQLDRLTEPLDVGVAIYFTGSTFSMPHDRIDVTLVDPDVSQR